MLKVSTPSTRLSLGAQPPADELIEVLRRENAALRGRLASAERAADSDMLTPLVNRRCMMREIGRTIGQVARKGASAAVLFCDMNELKHINDAYGHSAGDAALLHVAAVLRAETRSGDLAGRIGGDEFAVLLAQADRSAAQHAADRICAALAHRPLAYEGRAIRVGLAVGATTIGPHDVAETVLARADSAMYVSKAAQRSER
jgi:diguanylate cyclase (GGDEF)-like protein